MYIVLFYKKKRSVKNDYKVNKLYDNGIAVILLRFSCNYLFLFQVNTRVLQKKGFYNYFLQREYSFQLKIKRFS